MAANGGPPWGEWGLLARAWADERARHLPSGKSVEHTMCDRTAGARSLRDGDNARGQGIGFCEPVVGNSSGADL
jgi:hypothetical protein